MKQSKKGTAIITATVIDWSGESFSATCEITVTTNIPVQSIKLDRITMAIAIGDK